MRTGRLRVTLRDVSPAVVRVIDVPASSSLPELHELLQVALGWTNSHLHQFVAGDRTYGPPDPEWGDELHADESEVRLRDLPSRFAYRYDLGDYWEHDVEVIGAGSDGPGCVDGAGDCPPEDCGGVHGYAELRAVLADPEHERHVATREWAGELPRFDRVDTDLLLRQTVGEVPGTVRLLLDLLADGVKLTPGGRLPRSVVRQVQERYPEWHPLGTPASVEEHLYPLFVLHAILRRVGLLRLSKGVLRPTRAGSDDLEIIRRLRSWFDPDDFFGVLAVLTTAALSAGGPLDRQELAPRVHSLLGEGWSADGRSLTVADVESAINELSGQLEALDLAMHDWKHWRAGTSARTLLPRATALAALWSRSPAW